MKLGFRDRVDIAAWGDMVHVVWGSTGEGGWDIFHRRSLDGGQTWKVRKQLSFTPNQGSHSASVAVRGQAVHVVWWENPGLVRYRRSVTAGETWSKATTVATDSPTQSQAAIVKTKTAVVVAWLQWVEDGLQVHYRRSLDGGKNWLEQRAISQRVDARSEPALASQGNRVHIVWSDEVNGTTEVFHRRSLDAAATWGLVKRITFNSRASDAPALAQDGNTVNVVWMEPVGDWEIFTKRRN
jgi:hypothetical protein